MVLFEVAFLFKFFIRIFSVLNEVRLLESVSHPNIIRLEEVIDSPEFLVLILELAEGGELWDQMIKVCWLGVRLLCKWRTLAWPVLCRGSFSLRETFQLK